MARYNENECAYCTQDVEIAYGLIGQDRKVYCCEPCRAAGEAASQLAWEQWWQRMPVGHRHAPTEASAARLNEMHSTPSE